MKAEGGSEFMMVPASGGSLVMEGDVILKPTEAVDITMTTNDGTRRRCSATGSSATTPTSTSAADSWMSAPADDAASASRLRFKPEQLLGSCSNSRA